MDFSSAYFVQFALSTVLVSLTWILLTISHGKFYKRGSEEKRKHNILEIVQMVFLSFVKTEAVLGIRQSRFQKLYKKYASSESKYLVKPFHLKLFGKSLCFASGDYETIYSMNKNDDFNGRAPEAVLRLYAGGSPGGILFNDGNEWCEMKRYTMKKLGQMGFGKRETMTSILEDQLPDFMDRIERQRKESGNKIQVKGLFSLSILNVMAMGLGKRTFSLDDPEFVEGYKGVVELTNLHLINIFFLIFCHNIWGIRELFGYSRLVQIRESSQQLIKNYVDEIESLGLYRENPETFVDYFFLEIDKHKDNAKLKDVYTKRQLALLLQDLLLTGMDTTSKYLESFIMFMCLHPEVQVKVQHEIDSLMGTSGGVPSYYESKSRMPYTLATIYEIHRFANVIPITVRTPIKDVKIEEHNVTKGTLTINIYFPLRFDDNYWKDPYDFRPERFLDESLNLIQEKVDRMLIFGTGARVCPGENIAPAISFTFAVGFLQKYTLKRGDSSEILGLKEDCGATNGPEPFHISIFER